jgi:hypothetical protein
MLDEIAELERIIYYKKLGSDSPEYEEMNRLTDTFLNPSNINYRCTTRVHTIKDSYDLKDMYAKTLGDARNGISISLSLTMNGLSEYIYYTRMPKEEIAFIHDELIKAKKKFKTY